MCNLDSIYALIVLESASSRKQLLESTQNGPQREIGLGRGPDASLPAFRTTHRTSGQDQYILPMPGVLR